MSVSPSGAVAVPTAPPALAVSPAFSAGWLVAQLHGPLLDKDLSSRAKLPTVNELGRTDRIKLTLDELDALLGTSFGAEIAAHPPDPSITTADLRTLAMADDLDDAAFRTALETFHVHLLTRLTVADRRLGSAYSLGRSLSDTCWLSKDHDSFKAMFGKYRVANLQSWMTDLSPDLPHERCAAVSQGLGNWVAWLHVNDDLDWPVVGGIVQRAARAQGERWRGVLAGDKDPRGFLSPQAYVAAGDAALRRAVAVIRRVIAHLWVPLLIILLAMAGAVYIALRYAAGTDKLWTSLLSVVAGFGITAKSAQATAKSLAASATGSLLSVAEVDATGWATTVLPDIHLDGHQLRQLRRLGVAPPQVTATRGKT